MICKNKIKGKRLTMKIKTGQSPAKALQEKERQPPGGMKTTHPRCRHESRQETHGAKCKWI